MSYEEHYGDASQFIRRDNDHWFSWASASETSKVAGTYAIPTDYVEFSRSSLGVQPVIEISKSLVKAVTE